MAKASFVILAIRALAIWFAIILLESINGTVRELILTPVAGARSGGIISFGCALALISMITYVSANWLGANSHLDRIFVGLFWAAMTLGFEVVIARLLYGPGSDKLTIDYDPRQGGLMLLGLAYLAAVPTMAFMLRRAFARAP